MAEMSLQERKRRACDAIKRAPNRSAIERAIAQLDSLRMPMKVRDRTTGGDVTVLEHLGDGMLVVEDYGGLRVPKPENRRVYFEFASRYERPSGEPLVPKIELPAPPAEMVLHGKLPEARVHLYQTKEGVRETIWIPDEIHDPAQDLGILLGCGVGGVPLCRTVTETMVRNLWSRLPCVQKKLGGYQVRLVLAAPERR